jgi:hypothetical protein
MLRLMRPLACLLLLLLCGGAARAQLQESGAMERILNPDRSITYSTEDKTYYGADGQSFDASRQANIKEFYFVQKFFAKDYDNAKAFDTKTYWAGDFQFSTKSAEVKTDGEADKTFLTKLFATKTMQVKEANEATKSYAMAKTTYSTRESGLKGKTSDNHLEEMNKGQEQMNIDQVRQLLNKPRLVD